MVNDQLASSVEQIGKRLRAVRTFEDVILPHSFPRQFAALPAQFVPFAGEFLFGRKVRQPRLQPFFSRNYFRSDLFCTDEFPLSGYARAHVSSMLRAELSVSLYSDVSSGVPG
jgi:hypothetical protein